MSSDDLETILKNNELKTILKKKELEKEQAKVKIILRDNSLQKEQVIDSATSNILELKETKNEEIQDISTLDNDDLYDLVFNGEKSFKVRASAVDLLLIREVSLIQEAINSLVAYFNYNPVTMLQEFMSYLIYYSQIPLDLKTELAKSLYEYDKELGFNEIFYILSLTPKVLTEELSSVIKIELFKLLFQCADEEQSKKVSELLNTSLITNNLLEHQYRYKILLSIQKDGRFSFLDKAYVAFIRDSNTWTQYKILAGQYILHKDFKDEMVKDEVENMCIHMANDSTLDYNLRADVADLLVRQGITERGIEVGKEIIILLGIEKGVKSFYNDKQNVHSVDISESVLKILLHFASIEKVGDIQKIELEIEEIIQNGSLKSFQWLDFHLSEEEKKIEGDIKGEDLHQQRLLRKAKSSLLRIKLDQGLYIGNQTLESFFIKIWDYINNHQDIESLKVRTIEELIDMEATCSTGHVTRIANILSSYGFELNIGWDKQIESNLLAKIQFIINNMKDEDIKEKLLNEIVWTSNLEDRKNFNKFLLDNLTNIRDEMLKDFVDGGWISKDQFENYFRNAISKFEGN